MAKNLIYLDALKEELQREIDNRVFEGGASIDLITGLNVALLTIAIAPTVDAEEVVRCGNCKHFYEVGSTSSKGCAWGNCRKHSNSAIFANEFCSRGERSE